MPFSIKPEFSNQGYEGLVEFVTTSFIKTFVNEEAELPQPILNILLQLKVDLSARQKLAIIKQLPDCYELNSKVQAYVDVLFDRENPEKENDVQDYTKTAREVINGLIIHVTKSKNGDSQRLAALILKNLKETDPIAKIFREFCEENPYRASLITGFAKRSPFRKISNLSITIPPKEESLYLDHFTTKPSDAKKNDQMLRFKDSRGRERMISINDLVPLTAGQLNAIPHTNIPSDHLLHRASTETILPPIKFLLSCTQTINQAIDTGKIHPGMILELSFFNTTNTFTVEFLKKNAEGLCVKYMIQQEDPIIYEEGVVRPEAIKSWEILS